MKLTKHKEAGVLVKCSDELPEKNKFVNGRFDQRSVIVLNNDLVKGYITVNTDLEHIEDVEWLKPVKDVYVLTEEEVIEILHRWYPDDAETRRQFIKSITSDQ